LTIDVIVFICDLDGIRYLLTECVQIVIIQHLDGVNCQYRSQVIGWKDVVSEMTYYVSSGTLNSTNSDGVNYAELSALKEDMKYS